jgi:hypothetical protein
MISSGHNLAVLLILAMKLRGGGGLCPPPPLNFIAGLSNAKLATRDVLGLDVAQSRIIIALSLLQGFVVLMGD